MTDSRINAKSGRTHVEPEREHRRNPERNIEADQAAGKGALSLPPGVLLGSDFSERTFEHHAALLADPRMSQRMYARERANMVLRLQRDYGNRYVQRLVKHISKKREAVVQTKLTVGPAGDKYEQEADRVAKQVVDMTPTPTQGSAQRQGELEEEELQMKPLVQRQEELEEEEEELQMQPAQPQIGLEGGYVEPDVESAIETSRGRGQALPDHVRSSMEEAMGVDFSEVRVHTGTETDALNDSMSARAFTTGEDVFIRREDYSPDSTAGQELIAHELTHVVQQNSGQMQQLHPKGREQATPSDTGLERDRSMNLEENKTGLSDSLKPGVEILSGMAMDDVKVRYKSSKPAQLQALASPQGTDIHVVPGQERHVPQRRIVHMEKGYLQRLVLKFGSTAPIPGDATKIAESQNNKYGREIPAIPIRDADEQAYQKMVDGEEVFIVAHGRPAIGDEPPLLEDGSGNTLTGDQIAKIINDIRGGLGVLRKQIGPVKIEACMSALARKVKGALLEFFNKPKSSLIKNVKTYLKKEYEVDDVVLKGNIGFVAGSETSQEGIESTFGGWTELGLLDPISNRLDSLAKGGALKREDLGSYQAYRKDALNIIAKQGALLDEMDGNSQLPDLFLGKPTKEYLKDQFEAVKPDRQRGVKKFDGSIWSAISIIVNYIKTKKTKKVGITTTLQ